MLPAILNKSLWQHPTKHQLYGHLPPIPKTIQVRRIRHAGHCWRSMDELISDVLLWTPTYSWAKAGRPAQTYIQQLCKDTGCSPEDLPEAINDREKWRERVGDIRASGMTWWWWHLVWSIYISTASRHMNSNSTIDFNHCFCRLEIRVQITRVAIDTFFYITICLHDRFFFSILFFPSIYLPHSFFLLFVCLFVCFFCSPLVFPILFFLSSFISFLLFSFHYSSLSFFIYFLIHTYISLHFFFICFFYLSFFFSY